MSDYAIRYAEALNERFASTGDTFTVEPGKRYARIVRVSLAGRDRSAYAFVEIATGLVYKAAGWKAPAKGARDDLSTPAGFQHAIMRAERFGGHLYAYHL